jgi:signal transduction histidine kinase
MQRRQHIYLILKEAINNLIKYACCSNASIVVEYANGILKVEVADDGKGFDTERESHGNGLLNMKKRARALHGKLNIASSPGAGTRICLAVEID